MSKAANMNDSPDEKGTFQQLVEKNESRWVELLPRSITKEKFRAATHAAVRQNPDLLKCTQRSLFNALTKAAQDGLLPDGREGIITSYNTKHKVIENGREVDRYLPTAQWNPMTYGLRKRARELDDIIIDAQVVNKNDLFKRQQGDDPKIIHEPTELDTEPGPLVGCYAIFKREDGTILHREVMRAKEVTTTRDQSKAPDSLMWTKFETEGWKKTVIRRGIKTVPVSEGLERAITREDENFDFDQRQEAEHKALAPPHAPPPAPKLVENKPSITLDASMNKDPEKVQTTNHTEKQTGSIEQRIDPDAAYKDWLRDAYAELGECMNEPAVQELRERISDELKATDQIAWRDACADKATELFGGKKP